MSFISVFETGSNLCAVNLNRKRTSAVLERAPSAKHAKRLEPSTCAWRTSTQGRKGACCKQKCCLAYPEAAILDFRHHFYERLMSATDRRFFMKSRVMIADLTSQEEHPLLGLVPYGKLSRTFLLDVPSVHRRPLLDRLAARQLGPTFPVCAQFFRFVFGVSWNYIYQPGQPGVEMEVERKKRHCSRPVLDTKSQSVISWIIDLAQWYQKQPDADLTLLPFTSRKVVWTLYQDECNNGTPESFMMRSCSESYFKMTWRTDPGCRTVRLRKHLRFSLCDDCVDLRSRKKATRDRELLRAIRTEEAFHYGFVKGERLSYYNRKRVSVSEPKRFMSMIIDGADWKAYFLPIFREKSHLTDSLFRIPVYLMGSLNHGRGVGASAVLANCRQGTNVTIQELYHQLVYTHEELKQDLPENLFLQLDNTTKQCKSK